MNQGMRMTLQKLENRLISQQILILKSILNAGSIQKRFLIRQQFLQSEIQNRICGERRIFHQRAKGGFSLPEQSAQNHGMRIRIAVFRKRDIGVGIDPDDAGIGISAVQIVKRSERNQAGSAKCDDAVGILFENFLCRIPDRRQNLIPAADSFCNGRLCLFRSATETETTG